MSVSHEPDVGHMGERTGHFIFYFKKKYLLILGRVQAGEEQREEKRESEAGSADSSEPNVGLELTNQPQDHDLSQRWTLSRLSPPGAPELAIVNIDQEGS